jgi:TOBE domain
LEPDSCGWAGHFVMTFHEEVCQGKTLAGTSDPRSYPGVPGGRHLSVSGDFRRLCPVESAHRPDSQPGGLGPTRCSSGVQCDSHHHFFRGHCGYREDHSWPRRSRAECTIRPEGIRIVEVANTEQAPFVGTVRRATFLGSPVVYEVSVEGLSPLLVQTSNPLEGGFIKWGVQ